ncbi:UvrD-helicase domain-containing protein [Campylobacter canadensis]|uniref:UvrD-helicase domain-containing protein n=1 Tax=Campylobacter canadensis TaxID=449520 RepID=UPI001CCDC903|nr:UvrD-helicase domain-containing protein [Campylobacter canadensis]MBZ8002744.1 ATP-dependent helicase [Campylobacter canadensis]
MLTEEQNKILSNIPFLTNKESAGIIAPAGSGKTFILTKLAEKLKGKKILYLAYNKAIKDEAKKKFPKNVEIQTIHSFAYKYMKLIKNNYNFDEINLQEYNVSFFKEYFNLEDEVAIKTKQKYDIFINSDIVSIEDEYIKELFSQIYKKNLKLSFGTMLKLFSLLLKENELIYDFIFLDEAQDSNLVTLSILKKMLGTKVFIGDPNQAIYSFRYCVDIFKIYELDYIFYLTKTFRCSNAIVTQANNILFRYKNQNKNLMISHANNEKSKRDKAIITRTNIKILDIIAKAIRENNFNYRLLNEPNKIFKLAIDVYQIFNKTKDKISLENKYLTSFCDLDELSNYANDTNDQELKTTINIVKKFKGYIFILKEQAEIFYKNKNDNDIIICTAHTSKGLEFYSVILEKDFPDLETIKEKLPYNEYIEEVNLLYVAVTRAKEELLILGDNNSFLQNVKY